MQRRVRVGLVAGVSLSVVLGISAATRMPKLDGERVTPSIYGTHIPLQAISNAQDLGGIKTLDGRTIRPHRLIRSNQLTNLTPADRFRLTVGYNVQAIADLRSDREIRRHPDESLPNVHYYQNSVVANNYGFQTIKQFYVGLVSDQIALAGYRAFFAQLLQQKQGATLFHCTYGKDRTGVAALLLLTALGVSKQTILENYLYANHNLLSDPHVLFVGHAPVGKELAGLRVVAPVRQAHLAAVYHRIEQRYGSMDRFLTVLGMTPSKRAQLQALYLTD